MPVCQQTIVNAMGGITFPFCACYSYTEGETTWELHYTPNKAWDIYSTTWTEGWVVNPVTGWQEGEPEIFWRPGVQWYLFVVTNWGPFASFITNSCTGMNWSDLPPYPAQTFCCSCS